MSTVHLVVSKNGSHGYTNLQSAFDAIMADPECTDAYIDIKNGTYSGQFYFDGYATAERPHDISLHLQGDGMGQTLLTGALAATDVINDTTGEQRGTFRTYTLFVSGPKITIADLTIENTAGVEKPQGKGKQAGQALALYDDGALTVCSRLSLLGYQDTLFVSPLPEKERLVGGFKGPRDGKPRIPSIHVYKHCYIEGTVDFIFGGGAALFDSCIITAVDQKNCDVCYIAAPSADVPATCDTKTGVSSIEQSGFIFFNCQVTGFAKVPVYLGRPWRPYARCAYIECELGAVITSAGWDNWQDSNNEKTCYFAEYNNRGAGAQSSRAFGVSLQESEVAALMQLYDLYRN